MFLKILILHGFNSLQKTGFFYPYNFLNDNIVFSKAKYISKHVETYKLNLG